MPYSDQISAAQTAVAKSVVGRDTSAEERGGFDGVELIRKEKMPRASAGHDFRVSSELGVVQGHLVYKHSHYAMLRFDGFS